MRKKTKWGPSATEIGTHNYHIMKFVVRYKALQSASAVVKESPIQRDENMDPE